MHWTIGSTISIDEKQKLYIQGSLSSDTRRPSRSTNEHGRIDTYSCFVEYDIRVQTCVKALL